MSFKIVVGGNLARAHAFYLKMGCAVAGEIEVHSGECSIVYVRKVPIDQVSDND